MPEWTNSPMQDGWCVKLKTFFHCTPDMWLTTVMVISYVSTIQTTSTSVVAASALPTYLTVLTLHFYFTMLLTHKYIPYIPTSDIYSLKHVPFKFSMCSPRVLPIAPWFNPTCLAQSPPLLTNIPRWAKGPGTPSFHIIFCFGEPPKFQLFFVMGESNWLIERKKKCLSCEAPPTN